MWPWRGGPFLSQPHFLDRCYLRLSLLTNELSVPVTAVFDDAALSRIVNVDQAKTLAIALSPLKIIHERPDEVTLDGRALANNFTDRLNMRLEVVYTLRVVNAVVAVQMIVESRATLRNGYGFWSIIAMNTHQDIGETIRKDLPPHLGIRRAGNVCKSLIDLGISMHRLFCLRSSICAILHNHPRIVVDPQEIDGCRNDGQVAIMDWRGIHPKITKKGFRVLTAKHGVHEPAITESIGSLDREKRFGTIIGSIGRIEINRDAYLCLGREVGAHAWHGQAMRE